MTDSPSSSRSDRRAIRAAVLEGRLRVPSSKSVTHRCFNLGLLARRPMVVEHPLYADDTRLFLGALRTVGFEVREHADRVELEPRASFPDRGLIHCGNAGTLFRFLIASLATVPGQWTLDGVPRLRERPVGPLLESLRRLGVRIDCLKQEGFAPLRIHGGTLQAGQTFLDAGRSSQYLSALLMAALRAPGDVHVDVRALTSQPYVDITLDMIGQMGGRVERMADRAYRVRPAGADFGARRMVVEGDYSAAAYPAAGAALTGGHVVLEGLRPDSLQGDRGFLDVLEDMGARVGWEGGRVTVAGGGLRAVEVDMSAMPDQVPTLAALAPFARGTTRIGNVPHLRIKESDRLRAMATELAKAGAEAEEEPAGLIVPGTWAESPPPSSPVVIDPHGDHRIAMSFAVVGLRRPGLAVDRPEVVNKSYPGFWDDWEHLLSERRRR